LTALGAVLMLILAVAPGHAAASADIQESAWPDREPDDKSAARLRSTIRIIRSRFAGTCAHPPAQTACPPHRIMVAGRPGYQLPVAQTDTSRFTKLADQARDSLQTGDLRTAWHLANDAVRLWRGSPLADAEGRPFAMRYAERLQQRRIAVEITRCESAIQLGMHREIVNDLQQLASTRPGDIGLTCMLVTALVRSGCPGEAGETCYRALRHANKYNFDTSSLQELQHDWLNGKIPPTGPTWSPGTRMLITS
jgi:DNA-binding SARP family transcriptional activator